MVLPLEIRTGVAEALLDGKPVVALETTVMTHGLPPPAGLDSARDCEAIVRRHGAVPATVGILRGRLVVGLHNEELAELAGAERVTKTSMGNLAAVLATGGYGSTSVSSTIYAASRAGIRVAASGGIGGVHRHFDETLDISPDLTALQRTSLVLVCAGAKSILDVPATREQLETRGVPVIGYRTDRFPLFFCRGGRISVDGRVETPAQIAEIFRLHRALGMESAVLAVAEVPAEDALDSELLEAAVEEAVAEADERGIGGRDLTPFILDRLQRRTEGASLRANLALLRNNCAIAADVARAIAGREA